MFVEVVEIEVLLDLLVAMKWGCEPSDSRQIIGQRESALTLLKVLGSHPFNIERMPAKLALSVVSMPVERWNDSAHSESGDAGTQRAAA